MIIDDIKIQNDGYVYCKSQYYQCMDTLNESQVFEFKKGINILEGDIDSSNFAISYLISMYEKVDKRLLSMEHTAIVNGEKMSLRELSSYACYIDINNKDFKNKTVKNLIKSGVKKSGVDFTVEQLIEMFCLTERRINLAPLKCGNERHRAMVAIGLAQGKDIFCFPWYSYKMYEYLKPSIDLIEERLTGLGKIMILPVGKR